MILTEINTAEVTIEVSSVTSLQSSAQTKVRQLDVTLGKEEEEKG